MKLSSLHKPIAFIIVIVLLAYGLTRLSSNALARPLHLTVQPFLYPPFPGLAYQSSIFDHAKPDYSQTDGLIVAFNGMSAYKTCPNPPPEGQAPPNNLCDQGGGYYWSYALGDYVYYNGHDGVDFAFSYRPIYAAADTDQVMYAGWQNPQDHRAGLGIYIRLHHPNGYQTWYGHMNSVAVQSCIGIGCAALAHGDVIGISGTTGNSTGAHLHFRVDGPQGKVDPYGWTGAGADPITYGQSNSLWVINPAVIPYWNKRILPEGIALAYPTAPTLGWVVDDGTAGFSESPAGCWTVISTTGNSSQSDSMRVRVPNTSAVNCTATWDFPVAFGAGTYAVYIRIPSVRATSEGAVYNITHAGRTDKVVINQAAFPGGDVTDGWVLVGKYDFNADGSEVISLTDRTQDEPAQVSILELGADAVRFVPATAITPTPITPTVSPTPTITRTPSNTPTASNTPTPSRTPTATNTSTASRTPTFTPTKTATHTRVPTRTFTPSRTPTKTFTPTNTRTPTATRTSTPTRTATRTPLPTATPLYYVHKVYFASEYRLNVKVPPYERAGYRYLKSSVKGVALYQALLDQYFKGPGYTERYSYGWIALYDGFTGYSKVEFADGVARVYLTGACNRVRTYYTIADLLKLNLKQFPAVKFVKVHDEKGQTMHPDGASDSIPLCLDPSFIHTPTPTRTPTASRTPTLTRTPTPTRTATFTRTPTRTPTPTRTIGPSPTRTPTKTRTLTNTPRPSDTRWPTQTRTPSRTPTPTRTP